MDPTPMLVGIIIVSLFAELNCPCGSLVNTEPDNTSCLFTLPGQEG